MTQAEKDLLMALLLFETEPEAFLDLAKEWPWRTWLLLQRFYDRGWTTFSGYLTAEGKQLAEGLL